MKSWVLIMVLFVFFKHHAQLTISPLGHIEFTVLETSISEAGNDFTSDLLSSTNENELSVTIYPQDLNNTTYRNWHIDVKRTDINWDSSLSIYVKKTAEGTSNYGTTTTGGETFMEVTSSDQLFFQGAGWITDIPIQYKISGISVTIASDTYSTEITYTLLDN